MSNLTKREVVLATLRKENKALRAELLVGAKPKLMAGYDRSKYTDEQWDYFNQIVSGEKGEEYRLATPYWEKRLQGRTYQHIVLKSGYPKAGDTERVLSRPWRGAALKTILHPHFGDAPVVVWAITVN